MSQGQIYPTAGNVSVFINGIHIDQAYRVDARESLDKTPIFGYNDTVYSKAVQGRNIVQGILVINFTFPGYLKAVLSEAEVNPKDSEAILKQNNAYVKGTINSSVKKTELIDSIENIEYVGEDTSTYEEMKKAMQAAEIARILFGEDKKTDQQTMAAFNSVKNYTQASESEMLIEALKEKYLEGGIKKPEGLKTSRSVLTYKPVTMDVYYGDPGTITWLLSYKDVEFTEISQQISAAGQDGSSENLFEVYQFICKERQIKRLDVPRSSKD